MDKIRLDIEIIRPANVSKGPAYSLQPKHVIID